MIAVLFEARAVAERQARYLELAAELRRELEKIEGFIDIERFQSLSIEGKILSLSWWESEDAVLAWKRNVLHQAAQREGQQTIFASYRIRVAEVIRDYSSETRNAHHV